MKVYECSKVPNGHVAWSTPISATLCQFCYKPFSEHPAIDIFQPKELDEAEAGK